MPPADCLVFIRTRQLSPLVCSTVIEASAVAIVLRARTLMNSGLSKHNTISSRCLACGFLRHSKTEGT
ncbi:hypothetical protein BJV78DRAFT_90571 [Lactifluus subvellereus]|nr:hypothetical protein BJV78DRAFT_90571 [Lactifluus subvellereus]